jgi:hypothetical protein
MWPHHRSDDEYRAAGLPEAWELLAGGMEFKRADLMRVFGILRQAGQHVRYLELDKTAKEMAHENLTKPHVAQQIEVLKQAALQAAEVSLKRTIEEYRRIAYLDPRDLVQWSDAGVHFTDSSELTPEQAAAVKKVKVTTKTVTTKDGSEHATTTMEMEFWDKEHALDKLGQHLGMFLESAEDATPVKGVQLMETAEAPEFVH